MSGTHVLANQGGVTVWCDECHTQKNAESWSVKKIDSWLATHRKECKVIRSRKISEALALLEQASVPDRLLSALRDYQGEVDGRRG